MNTELTPTTAAALDALINAGFDLESVPESQRDAAARLSAMLGLLDQPQQDAAPLLTDPNADDARLLIDVTMARVLRSRDRAIAGSLAGRSTGQSPLSTEDAAALDAFVNRGWQTADHDRDQRIASLLDLLETDADAQVGREQRISSTLDRLQSEIDENSRRMRLTHRRRRPEPMRLRLKDVAAIAAMVVVGCLAIWPMFNGNNVADQSPFMQGGLNPVEQVRRVRAATAPEQTLIDFVQQPKVDPSNAALPGAPQMPSWRIRFDDADWTASDAILLDPLPGDVD